MVSELNIKVSLLSKPVDTAAAAVVAAAKNSKVTGIVQWIHTIKTVQNVQLS